jgi:acyl-CoA reductase-like NAD-dependent aldehyde dehydrogenase
MSFFDSLQPAEMERMRGYLEPAEFAAGDCILRQGTAGDECFLIDAGRVRLELHSNELDTDAVLDYLEEGQVLGEFALFDRGARSATAYAETEVRARKLSRGSFDALCAEQPALGITLLTYMAQDFTHKLREMNERMKDYLCHGLAPAWVSSMVEQAQAAQAAFAGWPEERVDELVAAVAKAVAGRAQELGEEEARQTGLGVVEHKVLKIKLACELTVRNLQGRQAAGVQRVDTDAHVTEIACPVGVVFGMVPLTNPIPTMLFKTLICLKSRNAVILSCHRKAQALADRVGALIHDVLREHGADPNLVQWVRQRTSRVSTAAFMTHPGVALILATGGPSMVRAAYSSGTPAIGVGAGNAPVLVCADADPTQVARLVVASKSFDNGVICGSDNNLVVDDAVRQALVAALEAEGAVVLGGYEAGRFTTRVIDQETGHLRTELIGRPAEEILKFAGLARPGAKLIVVPVGQDRLTGPWGHEKLAPIISLFTVLGVDEGLAFSQQILHNMGAGHTAIIHTQDRELALRYASAMPASRVLWNCGGATGCIGIGNGLRHSWTLGCGTWGGTSTTDNVGYQNLLNVKRLAEGLETVVG